MTEPICPTPAFTWLAGPEVWSACTACGRFAWAHEQADPVADLRNAMQMWKRGLPPGTFPPTMKTT